MSLYLFDRCQEDKIAKIEAICLNELGFVEGKSQHPARQWTPEKPATSGVAVVKYDPSNREPLWVDTVDSSHEDDEDILSLIQRLISITGTTAVYNSWYEPNREQYDMADFQ